MKNVKQECSFLKLDDIYKDTFYYCLNLHIHYRVLICMTGSHLKIPLVYVGIKMPYHSEQNILKGRRAPVYN